MAYRLLPFAIVGELTHRSGWPYAMRHLRRHADERSIVLLDDYVERTFLFDDHRRFETVHSGPWIAICHHPPDMPEWYSDQRLQYLENSQRWRDSFRSLRLVVSLGENLTSWVRNNWGKPCVTVRHPSCTPRDCWSFQRFERNPVKRLIQVGTWLRNTQAVYHVECPELLKKTRLVQVGGWVQRANRACRRRYGSKPASADVEDIPPLSNQQYDRLLSENVVFLSLIASVANNTIVECIARNTPLVVNRLPGPVSYLGADYPLFYENLDEVPELLTYEKILSAHNYLRVVNKQFLSGFEFARRVVAACREFVPEFHVIPRALGLH